MVMQWRTMPDVSKYMTTDVEPNMDKQLEWFSKVSSDLSCLYFMIMYNKVPIGVINLASIDEKNSRCTAGYYIGDMSYRSVGAIVPAYIYNYVFISLKLNKIYGEVFEENATVMRLHRMYGYETVGVLRQHIMKDNKFHNMVMMELLADVWEKQTKYKKYLPQIEL